MTPEELDIIISNGEDERIEFKQALNITSKAEKAEFIKDMIALVNAHGEDEKFLIIGVGNDGSKIGAVVPDDATLQQCDRKASRLHFAICLSGNPFVGMCPKQDNSDRRKHPYRLV